MKHIANEIKNIISDTIQGIQFTDKYGGEIFSIDVGNTTHSLGGVFTYAKHVSIEFSNGSTFDDSKGILEGKGKHRRHIKIETLEDLERKNVRHYLVLAIDSI